MDANTVRRVLQVISWVALAGTIIPAGLYLRGSLGLPALQNTMLCATIVWFIATPLWMGRAKPSGEEVIP